MSGLGALFTKWNAAATASGPCKTARNPGNGVTANKSTTSQLHGHVAPGNHQLIEIAVVTELPRLPTEIQRANTRAEWWRDPVELRVRFEEIAGYLEFDNYCDRDEAERLAWEALAHELRDEHGLAQPDAVQNLNSMKESER